MPADYVLGPGDQILVRSLEMEELNERVFVIDGDGNIALPLIGILHVAGLTADSSRSLLIERMKKFVRDPQLTVTITQFRSDPVFIVGAFRSPGTYPLQGRRTVSEMVLMVGGLAPGTIRKVRLTRKTEQGPIPGAVAVAEGTLSSMEIPVTKTGELAGVGVDLVLKPYDVLTAEKADPIYLTGEIGKIGGLEIGDHESLTVMQAVAMSGGLTREANGEQARVLRQVLDTNRRAEIPVNVKGIMEGRERDFLLMPNDVLFVPRKSGGKRNAGRIMLYALPLIPTMLLMSHL